MLFLPPPSFFPLSPHFPPSFLDLSFNNLLRIENLDSLVKLEKLFLIQNKISALGNLSTLTCLTMLELGSNRIRVSWGRCDILIPWSLIDPLINQLILLITNWSLNQATDSLDRMTDPLIKKLILLIAWLIPWSLTDSLITWLIPWSSNWFYWSHDWLLW